MKVRSFLLPGLILVFLSACAQMNPMGNVQNNEIHNANRLAIDYKNHDALAKYHENIANEMQAKLQEQKKRLQEYEDHNYYYGRKGLDLKSHATANIRYYEQSLEKNLKEAAIHRKMAKEQKELNYTDADEHNSDSIISKKTLKTNYRN
ncbi:hypothetical protein [Nitrosomonas sp. Nm33]|uniref:hypothetical protein n=1 Tax=Nitrosomonas sp. Nm33 TaxID=133724 RepID=UPI00089665AC|nr:hypothetical protein [Nitrosomonas sp. Nm33]SDY66614.1 hypothetical protein SAMN05421755_103729 [Nitrosomonas sp. Nm33]